MFRSKNQKLAKHLLHGARKLLHYRRDVLADKQLAALEQGITDLEAARKSENPQALETAITDLDETCAKISPPRKDAGWRENIEVLLVAIVIATGIKAYFVQPFKIPTGSMQPTLSGIIGTPLETTAPNFVRQALEFAWLGRNYIDVVSQSDDNQVISLTEFRRFHFFTFTRMESGDGVRTIYAPMATLVHHFGVSPDKIYSQGEVIARGYVDTGDQVFVDKVTYNFRSPKRGDVFVFKTTGIRRIESGQNPAMGAQFYIKRLVGEPGDELRIDPPDLIVNGGSPEEPGIRRVIESESGYRGYSNTSEAGGRFELLGTPGERFQVPAAAYFAMGDNSFNSSDSRHWGTVPERNVVGRGFLVYWPFSSNWGVID